MAALTSFCRRGSTRQLRTLAQQPFTDGATIIDHVSSMLDACSQPHHLPQAHALLLSSGLHSSHSLSAKFILFASSIGHLRHAHNLFDQIPQPNVFVYNTLIKSHSHHSSFSSILRLYTQMFWRGISPDGFTFPAVLKACGALHDVQTGLAIHCHVLRLGFDSDVFILNGLISMYAKSGAIASARKVFDHLPKRNVVSWTSVISGCAQNGLARQALRLFRDMRRSSDVKLDFISLVSVLKAYTDVEDLARGSSVQGLVIKGGFADEPDLLITLTAMYAKCGCVLVAKSLFDCVLEPDVILWNAMISGYVKNGCCHEAVELFRRMIAASNVKPDSITIRSAISACAQVGSLDVGKWMGEYTARSEYTHDVFVNTALIDMYSKCGSLARAHQVFDRIRCKDVVVWSAIIVGYGWHGRAREAIEIFNRMRNAGVRPNDVTFLGLLSGCNHAGLVTEGLKYFYMMREFGIEARHQHYACVVDLVARAGGVEEAYELIKSMPMEPAVTVWGALLNACNIYGHVDLGEIAADRIFALDPKNAGHYVQLSNIYASAGMWSDAAKVRVVMKEHGVTKDVACSSI